MLDGGQWEPSATMGGPWQAFLADNPISSLLPPPQTLSLLHRAPGLCLGTQEMGAGPARERAAIHNVPLNFLKNYLVRVLQEAADLSGGSSTSLLL